MHPSLSIDCLSRKDARFLLCNTMKQRFGAGNGSNWSFCTVMQACQVRIRLLHIQSVTHVVCSAAAGVVLPFPFNISSYRPLICSQFRKPSSYDSQEQRKSDSPDINAHDDVCSLKIDPYPMHSRYRKIRTKLPPSITVEYVMNRVRHPCSLLHFTHPRGLLSQWRAILKLRMSPRRVVPLARSASAVPAFGCHLRSRPSPCLAFLTFNGRRIY